MLFVLAANAQTRAWLDRDRIALGETTTLNIQADQASATGPDYSPLLRDFDVSGNSSSRQFELVNGVASQRMLFAVALQPKREGLLAIPSLRIGNQRTQPLTLTVSPQAAAPAHGDGAVFIDTEADAQAPYVQQSVGYTVRLYYTAALISGQLDQDPPEGASLQRVGEDAQYARDVGGRPYTVVERHFLLIPERSGTLTIPGARFRGKAAGGFFDDLLGDGQRDLHAVSAPRVLSVRPAPANAPQPWLPLRGLTLQYLDTPQTARAGEAATATIEVTADGATAAQLPELQLAGEDGAQVFADAPQSDDTFSDGRPQVRLTRRFSVVPARAGGLRIRGPRLRWWDVRAGMARSASLPDLVLQVAPGVNGAGVGSAPAARAVGRDPDDGDVRIPGVQQPVQRWALAAAVFAALWLVTLAWALQRRTAHPRDAAAYDVESRGGRESDRGGSQARTATRRSVGGDRRAVRSVRATGGRPGCTASTAGRAAAGCRDRRCCNVRVGVAAMASRHEARYARRSSRARSGRRRPRPRHRISCRRSIRAGSAWPALRDCAPVAVSLHRNGSSQRKTSRSSSTLAIRRAVVRFRDRLGHQQAQAQAMVERIAFRLFEQHRNLLGIRRGVAMHADLQSHVVGAHRDRHRRLAARTQVLQQDAQHLGQAHRVARRPSRRRHVARGLPTRPRDRCWHARSRAATRGRRVRWGRPGDAG